jgi:hypothetical protein
MSGTSSQAEQEAREVGPSDRFFHEVVSAKVDHEIYIDSVNLVSSWGSYRRCLIE